ncbi:hypothetical protein KIL84_002026 [Mauremys mutica]|uniref:Uncharacterized protein n=1 Tax=Mauremys mutica TaxID=74926 RepID=A0A9D4AYC9_9SAUR|nr:hypothetical protein KIL84_002026 [Mauremys mutica]
MEAPGFRNQHPRFQPPCPWPMLSALTEIRGKISASVQGASIGRDLQLSPFLTRQWGPPLVKSIVGKSNIVIRGLAFSNLLEKSALTGTQTNQACTVNCHQINQHMIAYYLGSHDAIRAYTPRNAAGVFLKAACQLSTQDLLLLRKQCLCQNRHRTPQGQRLEAKLQEGPETASLWEEKYKL